MHRNIIVFGESGSGKSSLINMILEKNEANVSDEAKGCTFRSQMHITKNGDHLYDTVGFKESDKGTVHPKEALIGLLRLIKKLMAGVNLLIFVIKKGKITETMQNNYEIFVRGICQMKVPVVLVISGCEMDADSGKWFHENQVYFEENEMTFDDSISGCLTNNVDKIRPGMQPIILESYNETRLHISKLLQIDRFRTKHEFGTLDNWFTKRIEDVWNTIAKSMGWAHISVPDPIRFVLMKNFGFDADEATEIANYIATDEYIATEATELANKIAKQ